MRTFVAYACCGLIAGSFVRFGQLLCVRSLTREQRRDRSLVRAKLAELWPVWLVFAGVGGGLGGYVSFLIVSHRL